jgi:hypothetical protein
MFNRSQINTLGVLYHRPDNLFSSLPIEALLQILKYGDESEHRTALEQLLEHIVYNRVAATDEALTKAPHLLLYAGNVTTPSGDHVIRVTPYECALGTGDPKMVRVIRKHFVMLEPEQHEQARQYARYHHHIKQMGKEESYQFEKLFEAILNKKTAEKEIRSVLNAPTQSGNSAIAKKIGQFRADFAPKTIKRGMHFNYRNLLEALKPVSGFTEYQHTQVTKEERVKLMLIWRQIAGYLMRLMPACDQIAWKTSIASIYELLSKGKLDQIPSGDQKHIITHAATKDGLGYQYAHDIYGDTSEQYRFMKPPRVSASFYEYVKQKRELLLAEKEQQNKKTNKVFKKTQS